MIYYVYSHTRKDTGALFYIGTSSSKDGKFIRAKCFTLKQRNSIWGDIFSECGGQIKVDILFTYNNRVDCIAKEAELIKYYGKTCNGSGLLANISDFDGGGEKKRLLQYSIDGQYINTWVDMYEAASFYKVSFKAISQAIHNPGSCAGFLWKWYSKDFELYTNPYTNPKNTSIHQFDTNGNLISFYKSIGEASRKTNVDRGSISNCAIGNRRSAGGFVWSYSGHFDRL